MACVMTAMAGMAQIQFSLVPRVGVSFPIVTGIDSHFRDFYSGVPGLHVGIDGVLGISPKFELSLGVFYTNYMVKTDMELMSAYQYPLGAGFILPVDKQFAYKEGTLKESMFESDYDFYERCHNYCLKIHRIDIPLMLSYRVWKGLDVKAGVMMGIITSGKYSYDCDVVVAHPENLTDPKVSNIRDKTLSDIDIDVKYKLAGYIGFPIGLSYEYKNFIVDARYTIAYQKLFFNVQDTHENSSQYRSMFIDQAVNPMGDARPNSFLLTLGYRFRLKK